MEESDAKNGGVGGCKGGRTEGGTAILPAPNRAPRPDDPKLERDSSAERRSQPFAAEASSDLSSSFPKAPKPKKTGRGAKARSFPPVSPRPFPPARKAFRRELCSKRCAGKGGTARGWRTSSVRCIGRSAAAGRGEAGGERGFGRRGEGIYGIGIEMEKWDLVWG